jgi:hypothetical protein
VRRVLLAIAALTLSLPAGARAAAPDPYQIFAHARAVWVSQRYPHYLSYTIAVDVNEKGTQKANHYRATYDALHDHVYANTVSQEERLDPHVPTGVNMSLEPKRQFQTLFKKRVGDPEEAVDYLGVPMLAPNYSFGIAQYVPQDASSGTNQAALVEAIRRQFNDPMGPKQAQDLSDASGLKEIGNVASTDRAYTITFDGIETVNGRQTYHLSLRPVHLSDRLRLREIWIDTQSYDTCRLVTQGNFANDTVPWVIDFADIGGAQYIVSENAEKPVSVGPHTYEQASISFEGITAVQPPMRYLWNPVTPVKNVLVEPND